MYKSGSVDSIVDAVAAKLKVCTFIVYCADDRRFGEISEKLHGALPDVQMMGTTGFMFNENGSFAEGISAVVFLDSNVESAQDTQSAIRDFNTIAQEVRDRTGKTVAHAQSARKKAGNIQEEMEKEKDIYSNLNQTVYNLKMQLPRKSVLFEDVKNVLCQIPYICGEYEGKDVIVKEESL